MNTRDYSRHLAVMSFLWLLVLLPSNVAPAEQLSNDTRISDALERLTLGTPIRVLTRNTSLAEGRLVSLSDAEVVVDVEASDRLSVALHDIDRVWVKGNQNNRGALRGMLLGGLVGGVILSAQESPVDPVRLFVAGAVAGAFGGVFLGSVIGSQVPKWELIFQRKVF